MASFKLIRSLLCIPFPFLTGCASYSKVLINSEGQSQSCMVSGGGLFGIAMAKNAVQSCVSAFESAGYLDVESAGTSGLKINNETPPRVLRVTENSPAEKAGIVQGDRVTGVDGADVKSKYDADILLFGSKGTKRKVRVMRDTSVLHFDLNLESASTVNHPKKVQATSNECNEIRDPVKSFECHRELKKSDVIRP